MTLKTTIQNKDKLSYYQLVDTLYEKTDQNDVESVKNSLNLIYADIQLSEKFENEGFLQFFNMLKKSSIKLEIMKCFASNYTHSITEFIGLLILVTNYNLFDLKEIQLIIDNYSTPLIDNQEWNKQNLSKRNILISIVDKSISLTNGFEFFQKNQFLDCLEDSDYISIINQLFILNEHKFDYATDFLNKFLKHIPFKSMLYCTCSLSVYQVAINKTKVGEALKDIYYQEFVNMNPKEQLLLINELSTHSHYMTLFDKESFKNVISNLNKILLYNQLGNNMEQENEYILRNKI